MSRPSEETVGDCWVDDAGRIWRQVSYSAQPTATFERIDVYAGERLSGVVGSVLLGSLIRLVPERAREAGATR